MEEVRYAYRILVLIPKGDLGIVSRPIINAAWRSKE
jgi:hypothetical protein